MNKRDITDIKNILDIAHDEISEIRFMIRNDIRFKLSSYEPTARLVIVRGD